MITLRIDEVTAIRCALDRYRRQQPALEDTFRATKQSLHIQQPQSWRGEGPTRVATLGFAMHSFDWRWFISLPERQRQRHDIPTPWYTRKATPSFIDALVALRASLWKQRISAASSSGALSGEISDTLVKALARAA